MSAVNATTQHGYLVIADISGYTGFIASTELEHAQAIISELLELILSRLTPTLSLSKLEGDAVFVYAPESRLPRGETLLELIESTYCAFRDRAEAVHRRTTCTCRACRAIPMLDLKFMAHHGDYVVQSVAGIHEMAGSDVNLVHRLLKNHVGEVTGWRAYALFTEPGLEHMGLRPEGMHVQSEAYEHLGAVNTFSLDLRERHKVLSEQRRVVVEPEDAMITFAHTVPAPPPVVWDWLNDPHKRAQYTFQPGLEFRSILRVRGRTAVGARNHCVHGKDVAMVEDVLDWKPFEYSTVVQKFMGFSMWLTCQLTPTAEGGTQLTGFINGTAPVPGFLSRPVFTLMLTRVYPMTKLFENMCRCIRESLPVAEPLAEAAAVSA
ncbi:MAG: DUF2652 domain-containing protein [Anaerolineales bacterium]